MIMIFIGQKNAIDYHALQYNELSGCSRYLILTVDIGHLNPVVMLIDVHTSILLCSLDCTPFHVYLSLLLN